MNLAQNLAKVVHTSPCIALGINFCACPKIALTFHSALLSWRQRGCLHRNKKRGLEGFMIKISKSVGTHGYVIWDESRDEQFVHSNFPDHAFSICKDGKMGLREIRRARQNSGLLQLLQESQDIYKKNYKSWQCSLLIFSRKSTPPFFPYT